MVPWIERANDGIGCCHPGCECETVAPILQYGDGILQRCARRVSRSRIFIALMFADPLLRIGGRLVNRGHHRARFRIRLLPGVDRQGLEMVVDHRYLGRNCNLGLSPLFPFCQSEISDWKSMVSFWLTHSS